MIDADRVTAFADVTEDWQPIHLNEAKAQAAGLPGPIAHGFLTLSLLVPMSAHVQPALPGLKASLNYGFDRVRFLSPVPVGSRIRGRFSVASVDEGDGFLTVHWDVTVEIDGQDKPAVAAQWITRLQMED